MTADGEHPVPESVQALDRRPPRHLPPTGRSCSRTPPCIGKVFWVGALAAMGGASRIEVVQTACTRSSAGRCCAASAGRRSRGEVEYAFRHVLVRDVAYGQIPRAQRAEKHEAAAGWMRATAGDRASDVAELLAYHYEQALSLATTAGLDEMVGRLRPRALEALEMAGARAMSLDSRKAYQFYRRALELSVPGSEHGRLLIEVVRSGSGNFGGSGQLESAEGTAMLVQAVEAVRASGDTLALGRALTMQSRYLWFHGDTEGIPRAAVGSDQGPRDAPGRHELADAYAEMAGRDLMAGRMRSGRDLADKALELADAVGAKDVYARTLQFRGTFRIALDGDDVGGLKGPAPGPRPRYRDR